MKPLSRFEVRLLIRHHVAYEERDGVDWVVWMRISSHRKLHRALRDHPMTDEERLMYSQACNRLDSCGVVYDIARDGVVDEFTALMLHERVRKHGVKDALEYYREMLR